MIIYALNDDVSAISHRNWPYLDKIHLPSLFTVLPVKWIYRLFYWYTSTKIKSQDCPPYAWLKRRRQWGMCSRWTVCKYASCPQIFYWNSTSCLRSMTTNLSFYVLTTSELWSLIAFRVIQSAECAFPKKGRAFSCWICVRSPLG